MSEERVRRPRGRKPRRKVCQFCVDKIEHIDYKDLARLRRFVTERGKSCPAACPATAPSISASSPLRSSARATSLCCPTPRTDARIFSERRKRRPALPPFLPFRAGIDSAPSVDKRPALGLK